MTLGQAEATAEHIFTFSSNLFQVIFTFLSVVSNTEICQGRLGRGTDLISHILLIYTDTYINTETFWGDKNRAIN